MAKTTTNTLTRSEDPSANCGPSPNNGDKKVRCKSLVVEGTRYRTHLNSKFENRKAWEAPDPKLVFSTIPGTIVKIFVSEGQQVKEGDHMLVLEAMKMKNNVFFHSEGRVKSVNVKEGVKVPKNFLMVEME